MPVKSSNVSLAKALFLAMLVVLSTMEMLTAEGLSVDGQVLDTLHVGHTSLASRQKRYLRSAADVTSTDRSNRVEVRRLSPGFQGLEQLPARLFESASKVTSQIVTKAKVLMFQHKRKTSDDVFVHLKLDKMGKDLFDSPNLATWIAFVKATTRTEKEAIKQMYETLKRIVSTRDLVKALGGVKASHTFGVTAQLLREHQMKLWVNRGVDVKKAAKDLGLDEVDKSLLFDSPEFTMWRTFMTQKKDEYLDASGYLIRHQKTNENELLKILAGIDADNENVPFAQALIYNYLWKLWISKVSPKILYTNLELKKLILSKPLKTPSDVDENKNWGVTVANKLLSDIPLGRVWLDYVYMCSYKNGNIDKDRVSKHFKAAFGDEFGGAVAANIWGTKDHETSTSRIKSIFYKDNIPLQDTGYKA